MLAVETLLLLKLITLQFIILLRNGTRLAVAGILGKLAVGILAIKRGENLKHI